MSKSIETIEGIGSKLGASLRKAGIHTVDQLLAAGGSKRGRAELARRTGISESRILSCVNMADLFRIHGVASQYAELLVAAGVDTVKELKHRNAENLATKMVEVNQAKNLVRRAPTTSVVSKWIGQSKSLRPMVSH